jgi:hypothetical protein
MTVVTREYSTPMTTTSLTYIVAGDAGESFIRELYLQDVDRNPEKKVVWRYGGKELRT